MEDEEQKETWLTKWFHRLDDVCPTTWGITICRDCCFEDTSIWFPDMALFLFLGRVTFVIGTTDTM